VMMGGNSLPRWVNRSEPRACARSVCIDFLERCLQDDRLSYYEGLADHPDPLLGIFDKGQKKLIGWFGILSVGTVISLLAATSYALALEPKTGEARILEDCDRRLCTMILRKELTGEDLKCELTKTWAKSTIKGADSAELKWGFGDARCSVHLHISRASIVTAITAPKYKLWVPAHTAECIIEQNDEVRT